MSQSLSQLWIHIVFSTKQRHPFLKEPDIRQRVYDYIRAICYENQCKCIVVGGVEDHVHILTSLHRDITLAKLVELIKKSSSKWIKTLDHTLKQFYWQNGYGAFSVSQSNLNVVKKYIENQYEHHKKINFKNELKKFLISHDITYIEKYLWE